LTRFVRSVTVAGWKQKNSPRHV